MKRKPQHRYLIAIRHNHVTEWRRQRDVEEVSVKPIMFVAGVIALVTTIVGIFKSLMREK